MNIEEFQDHCRQMTLQLEAAMETYLAEDAMPDRLREAMLYSLKAGGKRLRPTVVMFASRACGGQDAIALPAAAAMEMIHTYSLVHDDLPAMDDDDLRRGKPTNHKVFGEGMAILAGDALLTSAFATLCRYIPDDSIVRHLVGELAHASGAAGMIGGQVVDLLSENTTGTPEIVEYIHIHKTAMMFRGAARMGAICARADQGKISLLGDYGLKIGLAFQVIDDLLDVTSTAEALGKATHKDSQAGKVTYPGVMGIPQSQEYAERLITEAVQILEPFGHTAEPLRHLAGIMAHRKS